MSLEAGTTHEITRTVTTDLTADALGNKGVMVLATPCVLTLIENACSEMLQPHLPAGAATNQGNLTIESSHDALLNANACSVTVTPPSNRAPSPSTGRSSS